ncbi:MAG: tripartite tricarboxylate transporter permease [Pseudomonadota bacterium]
MIDFLSFFAYENLPTLLLLIACGVLVGYMVGVLPGFDITTGVALLLPLSYVMGRAEAISFFASMYCSGVFAGSITAILFRIPGTSESTMTAIEGYPFTAAGNPGTALGIAAICSGVAGVLATFVLMGLSPLLADVALSFGPGEYAALGLLGCAAVVSSSGGTFFKTLLAMLLGLLASTVGADPVTGEFRYVFAEPLRDGIGLVPAIIGLFAVADVLWRIQSNERPPSDVSRLSRSWTYPKMVEYLELRWTFVRGWLIGLFTGILPGAGASSAAFIAHAAEAQASRSPEMFGKGSKQALAAPETAKNAAAVGALIPLLALGIPGSATAAVVLGDFEIHDLQVGPLLFSEQGELVNIIFCAVLLANVMFVAASFFLMKPLSLLTALPYPFLAGIILMLAVVGSFATGGISATIVMVGFAVIGLVLKAIEMPPAPVILGLVIGPIIEVYFRRGLLMKDGDVVAVFSSPVALSFLAISLLMLLVPMFQTLGRGSPGRAS